jgi:hypothetical protein
LRRSWPCLESMRLQNVSTKMGGAWRIGPFRAGETVRH